jgi:hypothetical protein
MSDEESGPDDDGLEPWSRHGPDAARLAQVAAQFRALIFYGCEAAAKLKLEDRRRELVALDLQALICGVNEEDLVCAQAIVLAMASSVGGVDKLAPRRRGHPRQPVEPKPLKQPSAHDRQILDDIARTSLELERMAQERGIEVDRKRLHRVARDLALAKAEKSGDLTSGAAAGTHRKRIDRWQKREKSEQLRRLLVDAILGVNAPEKRNPATKGDTGKPDLPPDNVRKPDTEKT